MEAAAPTLLISLQPTAHTSARVHATADGSPSLVITDGSASLVVAAGHGTTGVRQAADFAEHLAGVVASWSHACGDRARPEAARPYLQRPS